MAEILTRKRGSVWEYRFEIAPVDGKRRYKSKSGFRTKADALKAGREEMARYNNAGDVIECKEDISMSDLLRVWLDEYSKTDIIQSTVDSYSKRIRLYIEPALGIYRVRSVTRKVLQDFINDVSDTGLSKNTVTSIRGILTSCFDWAELNGYITSNPSYRLKLPRKTAIKQREEKHVYIDQEYIEKIFQRFPVGSTSYLPMMIAYKCGLRLGEVFALTWDDIDFENKTIRVNKQIQWYQDKSRNEDDKRKTNGTKESGNGYWYFSPPKYKSYRIISVDDLLMNDLRREKEKQIKAMEYYDEYYFHYYCAEPVDVVRSKDDEYAIEVNNSGGEYEADFVLRRESGEYTSPRIMQHASSIIRTQLDFSQFDFHSFRHTHATMLLENGAPMVYIKNRLGHSKIKTTEDVYTNHLTEMIDLNGNDVMNKMFSD